MGKKGNITTPVVLKPSQLPDEYVDELDYYEKNDRDLLMENI